MTISTTASRIDYNGNGVTVDFSFPYLFLADADLVVILVDAAGAETVQTITTHYTLAGAGDPAGGTVTMLTAPATGERLVIYRDADITQEVDYITGDSFPAETHEQALDRLTMIAQRLEDQIERSLRLSEGAASTIDVILPAPIAGYVVVWNDTATGFASAAPEGVITFVGAAAPDETIFHLWYDTSTSLIKVHDGTSWVSMASLAATCTAAAVSAAADAVSTAADAAATAADKIATNADAVSTAADAAQTALDVIATAADAVSTAADVIAAAASEANALTYSNNASTSASNAATSESNAAASATAAQAAADSVIWNDVAFKTFADTPIAIAQADDGKLIAVDTSGGNVVINLPSIAGLTLPFTIGIKKTTGDANTVTINRNGTDTINGAASLVVSDQNGGVTLIPDTDPTPDEWTGITFGAGGDTNQVIVSSDDTTPGYLNGKLVAGTNITFTENNPGGNETLTIDASVGAAGVGQSELKTSTGEVSTAAIGQLTLPGGQYGFWPQLKETSNGGMNAFLAGNDDGYGDWPTHDVEVGSTYVTRITLRRYGTTGLAYAQQRYVTASPPYNLGHGDVPVFIFALVDNTTGDIVATYAADTPPWIYNGPTQAWADKYGPNGEQLRQKRVPKVIMDNRFKNEQAMQAYLNTKAIIKGQYEPITHAIKNADMPLIPHPFKPKLDQTVVVLDPLSNVADRIMLLTEGSDGGEISDVIANHVDIGNTPLDAGFDPSVMAVSASWKFNP